MLYIAAGTAIPRHYAPPATKGPAAWQSCAWKTPPVGAKHRQHTQVKHKSMGWSWRRMAQVRRNAAGHLREIRPGVAQDFAKTRKSCGAQRGTPPAGATPLRGGLSGIAAGGVAPCCFLLRPPWRQLRRAVRQGAKTCTLGWRGPRLRCPACNSSDELGRLSQPVRMHPAEIIARLGADCCAGLPPEWPPSWHRAPLPIALTALLRCAWLGPLLCR